MNFVSSNQGLPPPPPVVYQDVAWSLSAANAIGNLSNVLSPQLAHQQQSAAILQAPGQPLPTLADRLETYRQLTGAMTGATAGATAKANGGVPSQSMIAGMMSSAATTNNVVAQSAFGNYTSSLVERTQDLRNWLKQAKAEHELLSGATVHNAQTHM